MVWPLKDQQGIDYMAKVVANHSAELQAIRKLTALGPSTSNHTIPVQLVECSQTTIIVMPLLWRMGVAKWEDADLHVYFNLFGQILEASLAFHGTPSTCTSYILLQGLRFMHENNIAHLVRIL